MACPRGEVLLGLDLAVTGRSQEATEVLEGACKRLVGLVGSVACALAAMEEQSRDEAQRLVARAISLATGSGGAADDPLAGQLLTKYRLLGASLWVREDRGRARESVTAACRPYPWLGDPMDLALKDLPWWSLAVVTVARPNGWSWPKAHGLEGARLYYMVGEHRTGKVWRQYMDQARALLRGASAPGALLLAARISARLTDYPAVIEVLGPYVASHPGAAAHKALLMEALVSLGRFQEVVDLGPGEGCPACTLRVAEALRRMGRDGWVSLVDQALEAAPDHPRANAMKGRALLQRGELDAALARFRVALRGDPNDLMAARGYMDAANRLGLPDPAGPYQRALAAHREVNDRYRVGVYEQSTWEEAREALARGDRHRAEELLGFMRERDGAYPLIPFMELALQAEEASVMTQDRALDALMEANPWLP